MFDFLKKIKASKSFKRNSSFGKNVTFGPESRCHSEKKNNVFIGDNCDIHGTIASQCDGIVQIGSNTTIRHGTIIGCVNSIDIGNNVIISNNVHIYDNNNHPVSPSLRKTMTSRGFYGDDWAWKHSDSAPIIIEDNVWIGERSTILKGVRIGEGSIVGCASVVTKDVPKYSIVAGNPAKVVKTLDEKD